jgi:hypothetical protein
MMMDLLSYAFGYPSSLEKPFLLHLSPDGFIHGFGANFGKDEAE